MKLKTEIIFLFHTHFPLPIVQYDCTATKQTATLLWGLVSDISCFSSAQDAFVMLTLQQTANLWG
jgi:hypothetical protein